MMSAQRRVTLILPEDVINGVEEPAGGIVGLAGEVRLLLHLEGGVADSAYESITAAATTAAAIRIARAYVQIRSA
ncbi:MAG TPA: hypothetical protein VIL85_01375 [Thermomicrobiales bacterium]|jgi:hypothetical protein